MSVVGGAFVLWIGYLSIYYSYFIHISSEVSADLNMPCDLKNTVTKHKAKVILRAYRHIKSSLVQVTPVHPPVAVLTLSGMASKYTRKPSAHVHVERHIRL